MFKPYNKSVMTEVDGDMRIIGDVASPMCVLKDKDGVMFVGMFYDCEYVAAFITEISHGNRVSLYLDRQFHPCGESDAVRAIKSATPGTCSIYVKYESDYRFYPTVRKALRVLIREHSPFLVTKYTKDGQCTNGAYTKLVVSDLRRNTGVCISFTHGIHLLCEGSIHDCHRAVGGAAMPPKGVYGPKLYCPPSRWAWDYAGYAAPNLICDCDPDGLLSAYYPGGGFETVGENFIQFICDNIGESPDILSGYRDAARSVYERNQLVVPGSFDMVFAAIAIEVAKRTT